MESVQEDLHKLYTSLVWHGKRKERCGFFFFWFIAGFVVGYGFVGSSGMPNALVSKSGRGMARENVLLLLLQSARYTVCLEVGR